MSIAEALAEGGQTAVIGLGTVFAVLIILMGVLYLMKVIFYKDPGKAKLKTEPEKAAALKTEEETEDVTDDEELIAVLTAAVAASLNTSTYNLRIKSYKRVDGTKSPWQKAGIRETINSRF